MGEALINRSVCLPERPEPRRRATLPRRTRGPRALRLFGAQQQKSERVTRNLVMNRLERGCVCVRKANFVDAENQRDTGRLYTPLYYFLLKTQTRFAEPSYVLYCVLAFPAVFSFPPLNCNVCDFTLTVVEGEFCSSDAATQADAKCYFSGVNRCLLCCPAARPLLH